MLLTWASSRSRPSLVLNFLQGIADPRITYSGGANGTRVNSSGVIVAATTPRFDYDPVTLAAKGLLVEEARTNLALRSSEFDNAAWVKSNVTVSADSQISPDGTQNADTLTATSTDCVAYQTIAVSASTTYSYTVYLKAPSATSVNIYILTAGFAVLGSQVCSVTTQWQRFTVTAATGVNTSVLVTIGAGYSFVSPEVVYAWGVQLEAGAFPTSYIPTTTAAVTRTADSAVMTGTNFSSWYNQTQGTFVVISDSADYSGTRVALAAGDSALAFGAAEVLYASFTSGASGRMAFSILDAGVSVASVSPATTEAVNTPVKFAVAYELNNVRAAAKTVLSTLDSSATIPTPTGMSIGSAVAGWSSGASYLNGHIATIAFYPRRMADSQLQTLTA